jgi:predicted nucleotidyltransferase/DNA-binding transcriptional ArsR family regulator
MLETLLGSRLRAKILAWLFSHSDERYFVRQLTALLKEDSTNVSRELARLQKDGILVSSSEGKQKYYQANRDSPIYNELKSLVQKTSPLHSLSVYGEGLRVRSSSNLSSSPSMGKGRGEGVKFISSSLPSEKVCPVHDSGGIEDHVVSHRFNVPKPRLAEFCRRHHIRRLSLFGSVLRDDFKPDSDIDVLVEFEPGHVPGFAIIDIEGELSRLVGRKVDLRTAGDLSRYFRERVVREARLEYSIDS